MVHTRIPERDIGGLGVAKVVTPCESPATAAPAAPPAVERIDALPAPMPAGSMVDAARRVVESVVSAVVTSSRVYLVGSVYTDAYYGRMSVDATALDLTPLSAPASEGTVIQVFLATPTP